MLQTKVKLGGCTYYPSKGLILRSDGSKYKITKKPADLLELLYKNPNRYFSLDELQNQVWNGRTIQENTIHKGITRVRTALGSTSDPSLCEFIENRRTEGYRFKAEVTESVFTQTKKNIPPYLARLFLSLIVITLGLIFLYRSDYFSLNSNKAIKKPEILTTLTGQETNGTYAKDLLIFSHKPLEEKYWNLYAKKEGVDRYFRLTNGNWDDRRAVFSPDKKKIAFQRHDGKKCQIIITPIEQSLLPLDKPEVVYNCMDELLSVSITWKDNNNIYLSMTNSLSLPYQVYLLNLKTKQLNVITQPANNVQGDYYVSYSQAAEKLVYLRWVGDSRTEIWLYDPIKRKSKKLASMPVLLLQAAWSESGEQLIVRIETKKFGAIDINSGRISTVLDANYPVTYPFNMPNNSIGYVRGNQKVDDIIKLDLSGKILTVISSSFHDSMPVYAQNMDVIAFVSNRSGRPQIWILDKNGDTRQLTKFESSFRVGSLAISDDGTHLAYTINAQIHIIDDKGVNLFSSNDNATYKNPSFSEDGTILYYSINYQDSWRIESRPLNNLTAPIHQIAGYIAKPCSTPKCLFFIKYNQTNLFKWDNGVVQDTGLELGDIQYSSQLAVSGSHIYHVNNSDARLMSHDLNTNKSESLIKVPSNKFSFDHKNSLIYSSIRRESETMLERFQLLTN